MSFYHGQTFLGFTAGGGRQPQNTINTGGESITCGLFNTPARATIGLNGTPATNYADTTTQILTVGGAQGVPTALTVARSGDSTAYSGIDGSNNAFFGVDGAGSVNIRTGMVFAATDITTSGTTQLQVTPTQVNCNLPLIAASGATISIDFMTFQGQSNPSARIQAMDTGAAACHLIFSTRDDNLNTTAAVERLRLTQTGNLLQSGAGNFTSGTGGVTISGLTSASALATDANGKIIKATVSNSQAPAPNALLATDSNGYVQIPGELVIGGNGVTVTNNNTGGSVIGMPPVVYGTVNAVNQTAAPTLYSTVSPSSTVNMTFLLSVATSISVAGTGTSYIELSFTDPLIGLYSSNFSLPPANDSTNSITYSFTVAPGTTFTLSTRTSGSLVTYSLAARFLCLG